MSKLVLFWVWVFNFSVMNIFFAVAIATSFNIILKFLSVERRELDCQLVKFLITDAAAFLYSQHIIGERIPSFESTNTLCQLIKRREGKIDP